MTDHTIEQVIKGIPASPGICHGPVLLLSEGHIEIPCYAIDEVDLKNEEKRLDAALVATRKEILEIRQKVSSTLSEGEALIFDAHLMVLEDNALISEILQFLNDKKKNIEFCFNEVVERYIQFFQNLEDEYLRERVSDIRDVSKRVLNNLLGNNSNELIANDMKRIIVSDDITPSFAMSLNRESLLGFLTDSGGATSHFVIMSRSMKIPAVVGLHDATAMIQKNDYVLIDGYEGKIFINPSAKTIALYDEKATKKQAIELTYRRELFENCETKDGRRIELMANIEGSPEITSLKESNADGVGLFRTEGIFLRYNRIPSEEEQFEEYVSVVKSSGNKPIIIRTLDIGGDKLMRDSNDDSFLGLRAIRYCLENLDIFKSQLKAILRASAFGDVRLMYPMISGLEELEKANILLNEVKAELAEQKIQFDNHLKVGAMIELPSAVSIIDLIAPKVDFFSVGTNDLIQYLMAVDRMNDRVSHLYQPMHPAVLRSLKSIFTGGLENRKSVSICGEMAGEPLYAALLIGLGAQNLSLSISRIPEVKHYIRLMNFAHLKTLVSECMYLDKASTIEKKFKDYIQSLT
jgi:phosphotransferase system enzyme I (PtsI)